MNAVFVYARIRNEKVFIGIFESLGTIYGDIEMRLAELGHSDWTTEYPIYMMGAHKEPYRLLWNEKKFDERLVPDE